jgi:hypothetical protein
MHVIKALNNEFRVMSNPAPLLRVIRRRVRYSKVYISHSLRLMRFIGFSYKDGVPAQRA